MTTFSLFAYSRSRRGDPMLQKVLSPPRETGKFQHKNCHHGKIPRWGGNILGNGALDTGLWGHEKMNNFAWGACESPKICTMMPSSIVHTTMPPHIASCMVVCKLTRDMCENGNFVDFCSQRMLAVWYFAWHTFTISTLMRATVIKKFHSSRHHIRKVTTPFMGQSRFFWYFCTNTHMQVKLTPRITRQ